MNNGEVKRILCPSLGESFKIIMTQSLFLEEYNDNLFIHIVKSLTGKTGAVKLAIDADCGIVEDE
jgi:hypothetical protein